MFLLNVLHTFSTCLTILTIVNNELQVLHWNIDQTLVIPLHDLLIYEIGELDWRVITT